MWLGLMRACGNGSTCVVDVRKVLALLTDPATPVSGNISRLLQDINFNIFKCFNFKTESGNFSIS